MNGPNRGGTVQKTKAIEAAMDAVRYQEPMAISLFDELRAKTTKGKGVFRDAYGEGEKFAHRARRGCQYLHDDART